QPISSRAQLTCRPGSRCSRTRRHLNSPTHWRASFPAASIVPVPGADQEFVVAGESSLHRATAPFVLHYHQERNHQGLDNKIIRPEFSPLPSTGPIRCRKRLGGMLNYYYREAA